MTDRLGQERKRKTVYYKTVQVSREERVVGLRERGYLTIQVLQEERVVGLRVGLSDARVEACKKDIGESEEVQKKWGYAD
jgi:hypothetical protein